MTKIQLTRSGDQFIAEFGGCREIADTPIEAIEKAHRAAIKKGTKGNWPCQQEVLIQQSLSQKSQCNR